MRLNRVNSRSIVCLELKRRQKVGDLREQSVAGVFGV